MHWFAEYLPSTLVVLLGFLPILLTLRTDPRL